VDWLIEYVEPTNEAAEQLKSLFIMISEDDQVQPGVPAVPDHGFGCA